MKLLLFSDLHADRTAAERLAALAETADILVGAGDFGNQRRDVGACIDILKTIDRPAVLVAGNNESTDELRAACREWPHATILHGTGVAIGGVDFFGIGGGIPPTPFGEWSYDFSEEQATALLADCPRNCVLISHSPPHGAVDVASNGRHLGSTAVRATLERVRPRLVVCGHVHASAGRKEQLADSLVVNAGPAGRLWELP